MNRKYTKGFSTILLTAVITILVSGAAAVGTYFVVQSNNEDAREEVDAPAMTSNNTDTQNMDSEIQEENKDQEEEKESDVISKTAKKPSNPSSITLVYPSDGEVLELGSIASIQWSSSNIPNNTDINIYLSDVDLSRMGLGTSAERFIGQTNNTGYAEFFVPRVQLNSPNNSATLRLELEDQVLKASAGVSVELSKPSDNPLIMTHVVSSPESGEVFKVGDQITVEWDTQDYNQESKKWINFEDSNVAQIQLIAQSPCSNYGMLLTRTENDGMEEVTLISSDPNAPDLPSLVTEYGCENYKIQVEFGDQIPSTGSSATFNVLPHEGDK